MVHNLYLRSSRRFYLVMVLNIEGLLHYGCRPKARSSVTIVLCSRVCRSHIWRRRTCALNWFMVDSVQVYPAGHNRDHTFSLMFGREMRSKLPELRRETVDVSWEETRDKDWSNKLKGKTYADVKRGAVPKSIRVGDAVLLKAEKSNKLSSNFHQSLFKVVQKTGSEVTVRND